MFVFDILAFEFAFGTLTFNMSSSSKHELDTPVSYRAGGAAMTSTIFFLFRVTFCTQNQRTAIGKAYGDQFLCSPIALVQLPAESQWSMDIASCESNFSNVESTQRWFPCAFSATLISTAKRYQKLNTIADWPLLSGTKSSSYLISRQSSPLRMRPEKSKYHAFVLYLHLPSTSRPHVRANLPLDWTLVSIGSVSLIW